MCVHDYLHLEMLCAMYASLTEGQNKQPSDRGYRLVNIVSNMFYVSGT